MKTAETTFARHLVSVVMPCLNAGTYLRDAVQSVFDQCLPEPWKLELLLVDDGSRDPVTLELISAFRSDPRVRVIVNAEPRGVSRARNQAIAAAQGSLLAFLDADDKWESEHLATHVDLLRNPEIAFSATDYSRIDADGRIIATQCVWSSRRKGPELRDRLGGRQSAEFRRPAELFITACPAWIGSVVVRRDALMNSRPFNEALTLAEDLELWVRLALHHDFAFSRVATAMYRHVGASLTNSAGASRLDLVTGKMYEDLASQPEFLAYRLIMRKTAVAHYLSAAYEHRLSGYKTRALACIARAVRCLPLDWRPYRQLLALPFPPHLHQEPMR